MAVVSNDGRNDYRKLNLTVTVLVTLIIIKKEEKYVFRGRYEQDFPIN
jgi:hypothetical protein